MENGTLDLKQNVRAIDRCCDGLNNVDTFRCIRTISGLYDGATTQNG